jgi:hypothetical protein
MFRLLLLLIVAGVAGYFTNPTQAAHEAKARAAIDSKADTAGEKGDVVEQVTGYIKGALAGEGRYENFYVGSKYTLNMPGSSYVECYGAFTLVQCSVVEPS